jgi:hypothetical protein
MAKRTSLAPSMFALAALSCSFYVACGDDDIIIGDGTPTAGSGGSGGSAGSAGTGGSGGDGGSSGVSGSGGGTPVDGGADADAAPVEVPDTGTDADVGPTSNG